MSDDDFRELFAEEARGQLARLAEGALELERSGAGPELVAGLFRDAHTLKSSAALVGLGPVGEVAHELEDLLGELRSGQRAASSALADGILACADALALMIEALLAEGDASAPRDAARAGLARARDADADAPTLTEEGYGAPELRGLFAEEAGRQLATLSGAAVDLDHPEGLEERVALLLRGAHSLKGSAALVGLGEVAGLAHALEDVLVGLRDGVVEADVRTADAVLAALDALGAAVAGPEADADAALAGGRAALATLGTAAPVAAPAVAEVPAVAEAPVASPASAAREELVPVGLERLDRLVALTGEAVAAESRLTHLLGDRLAGDPDAEAAMTALRRVLGDVQGEVLATRMTSLGAIAGPLRRAARDVARARGREVDYALEGERVQLDRAVLDGLRDPLLHLVRNAVDHGLEAPEARAAQGKPRAGRVSVRGERRGREIVVTVTDDGAGLDLDALRAKAGEPDADDEAAAELVFRAGLSTAARVTDVSGRGVGMDAVRAGVEALRGRVSVRSTPGAGTTFTLAVPLTLAVVPCVLVRAGTERYALPTHATVALADVPRAEEVGVDGGSALWHGPEVVPVALLADVVGAPGGEADRDGTAIVLQGSSGERQALRVGAVLGQRDVTVRELGDVLPRTELVAGASLEADGTIVCVLDAVALVEAARRTRRGARGARPAPVPAAAAPSALPDAVAPAGASILVVDDALTVRELQRSILERAGHRVRTAVDGEAALALLAEERPDLVVTDLEMPRLDGFGLVRRIRAIEALRSVPVLMVTSRGTEEDRRRGLEAGADAYLVKRDFDERRLLEAIGRLLG